MRSLLFGLCLLSVAFLHHRKSKWNVYQHHLVVMLLFALSEKIACAVVFQAFRKEECRRRTDGGLRDILVREQGLKVQI